MKEAQPSPLHYVYIIRCANGSLYTGYTKNVEQRIAVHNAGKGARYTKAHRPVELVAFWQFVTKRAALQVEYQIKQMSRERKIAIVLGRVVPSWSDQASRGTLDSEEARCKHRPLEMK